MDFYSQEHISIKAVTTVISDRFEKNKTDL